jgi:hypothetical protein
MRSRSVVLLVAISFFFPSFSNAQLWSGILSPARAADWTNAGITGGVPNITKICTTLGTASQTASFAQSVTSAQIQSAIDACGSSGGGVVLLNTGTYSIASEIDLASNVVLRGDGPMNTSLVFGPNAAGPHCGLNTEVIGFCGNSSNNGDSPNNLVNWSGGYAQGASQVTLSSTAGLSVGQLLILTQKDDASDTGNYFVCSSTKCSQEGASGQTGITTGGVNHVQMEWKLVTGIKGNTVSISPALYSPQWRSGQAPEAWWSNTLIKNAGIENLTLDATNHTLNNTTNIMMYNSYGCWVKNIRSLYSESNVQTGYQPGRNHVWLVYSAKNIIRDSYFFGTREAATLSYGVETWMTGDDLVENNIFQGVVNGLLVGQCEGCVFAYNFGTNASNNNEFFQIPTPSFTHDGGTAYNLFEGNEGTGGLEDNIHGTHNMHTYFRNLWYVLETSPPKESQMQAAEVSAYARYMNYIGNVMGNTSVSNQYEVAAPSSTNCNTVIFSFGWDDSGCQNTYSHPNDTLAHSTSLRWGNWDTVTNATRWCGNSSDTDWSTTCGSTSEIPTGAPAYPNPVPTVGDTGAGQSGLPASFYLSGKPSWWVFPSGLASTPFPAVGPEVTGGDFVAQGGNSYAGHAYLIPAANCYIKVMGGKYDDWAFNTQGPILAFDADKCYGSGSGTTSPPAPAPPTGLTATVVP